METTAGPWEKVGTFVRRNEWRKLQHGTDDEVDEGALPAAGYVIPSGMISCSQLVVEMALRERVRTDVVLAASASTRYGRH